MLCDKSKEVIHWATWLNLQILDTGVTKCSDSQYGGDDQGECCVRAPSLKKSFTGQQLPVFPETDNTHHRVMATLL